MLHSGIQAIHRSPKKFVVLLFLLILFSTSLSVSSSNPNDAGMGELHFKTAKGWQAGSLVDVEIDVRVTGVVATGVLRQTFINPSSETLDARYVYPMPENAAVHKMKMTIGERQIESVIKEKQEARKVYEKAKTEGRKAALVEASRPNLFRTEVTGVLPNEQVTVTLEWIQEITFDQGAYSVVIPLAYTPRYVEVPWENQTVEEGSPDENNMQAMSVSGADHRSKGISNAQQMLGSPPSAFINVYLDLATDLEVVNSPSHRLELQLEGSATRVTPEGARTPCDRDFVLRWSPLRAQTVKAKTWIESSADSSYALTMLVPPEAMPETGFSTETVWLFDISSSMAGPSMHQAKRAMRAAIDQLQPGDRFNVIAFNDQLHPFSATLEEVNTASIDAIRAWIEAQYAHGGTNIGLAVDRASKTSWLFEDKVRRVVIVTDGAIASEAPVIRKVVEHMQGVQVHVLGIGHAPNRWFVREIAKMGRGHCAFVHQSAEAERKMRAFMEQISRPVLTQVKLMKNGSPVRELPDLHAAQPAIFSTKLDEGGVEEWEVIGISSSGATFRAPFKLAEESSEWVGIGVHWAKAQIQEVMDNLYRGVAEPEVRAAVLPIALEHGIVTRYTSFVAEELVPSHAGSTVQAEVQNAIRLSGSLGQGGTMRPLYRTIGLWSVMLSVLLAAYFIKSRSW